MSWTHLMPLVAQSEEGGMAILLVYLVLFLVVVVGMWKVFEKAGQPGILAIIPIVNLFFLMKVAGRPVWWGILFFIPIVSLIISFVIGFDIAKRFGRGAGTALGLIFLPFIFYPILGFGSATYGGVGGAGVGEVFD